MLSQTFLDKTPTQSFIIILSFCCYLIMYVIIYATSFEDLRAGGGFLDAWQIGLLHCIL